MGEHDLLFKRAFRNREGAAALLRCVLQPELLALIDLTTLEVPESAQVDPRLTERFPDAVVSVQFVGARRVRGTIRFLFEHISEPDEYVLVRVLEYLSRTWRNQARTRPAALVPMVAVVVFQGPEAWSAPRSFHEFFPGVGECEGLAQFVPQFKVVVDDLTLLTDEALAARPLPSFQRVALWVLRDGRDEEALFEHLARWIPEFASLERDDAMSILRYLYGRLPSGSFDRLHTRIVTLAPSTELTMQTIADHLIQQGQAKGKAEAKAEAVLAALEVRGVPMTPAQRAQVLACDDLAVLDRWFRTAMTCTSAEALFTD